MGMDSINDKEKNLIKLTSYNYVFKKSLRH
jgi:hypothetical protein